MLALADQHGFRFDTVQMPLNVMDAHFNSFGHRVLPVAVSKGMGILGMKSMGDHFILKSQTVTAQECLNFTMNLPVSVCITGCDSMKILQQGLDVARNFKPLTQDQVAAILAKTEYAAANGQYELYKTSTHFDTTAKNPAWLG
jgi:predicted aldo/keto reductase-like oxidoreductase